MRDMTDICDVLLEQGALKWARSVADSLKETDWSADSACQCFLKGFVSDDWDEFELVLALQLTFGDESTAPAIMELPL